MKETLKESLVQCWKSSESSGGGLDPGRFPSQILCLAEEIRFTKQCEQAIEAGKLQTFLGELHTQLESYTASQPGTHVLQLKLKALVLDLIHNIEVVEYLIASKTKSASAWAWQKQLR